MDISINREELEALYGLPHIQQLTYLRGIRPYMDVKTGITGIKRGISFQSIAEQLYVEPHQGIKSVSYSRPQVRRAIESLERAGLIQNQSKDQKLILKCLLASRDYCAQNKVITNPSQLAVTDQSAINCENKGLTVYDEVNAVTGDHPKAVTPLKDDSYLYLFNKFQQFWNLYPERKSKAKAFEAFKFINPDQYLFGQIMLGLQAQVDNRKALKAAKNWIPPWKYPANWLEQHCWEDSLTPVEVKEKNNATNRKSSKKHINDEHFCMPEGFEFETDDTQLPDNVIAFQSR